MIDFPVSPVSGQTYTYGGRTWVWDETGWQRQINAGQTVAVFVVGVTVNELSVLPTIDNTWYRTDYV